MKILIPILGFARAGGYRVLSELANSWIRDGHQVDFLVNEASTPPYFPTNAGIRWATNLGKLISDCERKQRSPRKVNGWTNLVCMCWTLFRIGKEYDIILANHSLTAWPIAFSFCGAAKKFYYIQAFEPEYYSLEKGLKARIYEWLSKKSYDFNLIQICNSPIYIGYKNVRSKKWVPPGVDFSLFYPKIINKDLNIAEEITLGCIGRREPAKGIRYVLEAFEILWQQNSRYQLHVAFGNLPDGWSHPGVKVIMPGNDRELSEFYRSLDIMIAPGIVQFGAPHYPVMEAMACGVPVVTTGYMPANYENSWLVESSNANSIVAAVNEISTSRMSGDKITKASEDMAGFSWESVAKEFETLFIEA